MKKLDLKSSIQGMTIVETLIGIAIVGIVTMGSAMVFADYWRYSSQQKKMTEGNDLAVMIMSDVMQSKYSDIVNLCNALNAWTARASLCTTINYNAVAPTLSITPQLNKPNYSGLLGKNLAGLGLSGGQSKSCVDLIQCKYLVSADLLEVTFKYFYQSSKSSSIDSQVVNLRRGPW